VEKNFAKRERVVTDEKLVPCSAANLQHPWLPSTMHSVQKMCEAHMPKLYVRTREPCNPVFKEVLSHQVRKDQLERFDWNITTRMTLRLRCLCRHASVGVVSECGLNMA
jgi:hypothetical protein